MVIAWLCGVKMGSPSLPFKSVKDAFPLRHSLASCLISPKTMCFTYYACEQLPGV